MHEVVEGYIDKITCPMHISNQPNELNSTEIANDETTSAENHEYNGASPPHGTIPSLPQSPLTYASIATDEPLTRPLVEAGNDSQIAYMADHPKVHPKAANDALFGIYQDWVHQNTGNHLDSGI